MDDADIHRSNGCALHNGSKTTDQDKLDVSFY
jgi:hypothetical protein